MNRQSIRQGIQAEIRYAPTNAISTADLNAQINLEMQALAGEYDWPFLVAFYEYPLYMDFQIDATMSNGTRTFVPSIAPTSTWVGAFFVDQNSNEYEIAGQDGTNVYLVQPWVGTDVSQTQVWIRFRQYRAPRDCMKELDQVLLQQNNVMESPIEFVSQTDKSTYPWTRNVGGSRPFAWMQRQTQDVQPPIVAPTAAPSAGASTLVVQPYRYAYTNVVAGRESSPSLIAGPVTPTGGAPRITLSGMEVLTEGVSRRIYREDNASGVFFLRAQQDPPLAGITTYVDTGAAFPTVSPRLSQEPTQRYVELRPYPGLATYSVRMRYLRRLAPLQAENDAPQWDSSYHDVLIWRVVVRMLTRPGMEPKDLPYAQARLDERYGAMRAGLLADRIRAQRRLWRAEGSSSGNGPPGAVPRFTNI